MIEDSQIFVRDVMMPEDEFLKKHEQVISVWPTGKEIDLEEFFLSHQVIKYRVWPQALFTYGKSILKQDWDENCYIAGDVNGLGLEPASIAGIYAANRILGVC